MKIFLPFSSSNPKRLFFSSLFFFQNPSKKKKSKNDKSKRGHEKLYDFKFHFSRTSPVEFHIQCLHKRILIHYSNKHLTSFFTQKGYNRRWNSHEGIRNCHDVDFRVSTQLRTNQEKEMEKTPSEGCLSCCLEYIMSWNTLECWKNGFRVFYDINCGGKMKFCLSCVIRCLWTWNLNCWLGIYPFLDS